MVPSGNTSYKIEEISEKYILEILKTSIKRYPNNVDILFELGDLLTKRGFIKEGLDVDLKLSKLLPDDPVVHYNLACSYSLLGRKKEAFNELKKAISLGYDDIDHMKNDRDLDPLKEDPKFKELIRSIQTRKFFLE